MVKLCINCKHCTRQGDEYLCHRRVTVKETTNLVTGSVSKSKYGEPVPCGPERIDGATDLGFDRCGVSGKYYEPKTNIRKVFTKPKYSQSDSAL